MANIAICVLLAAQLTLTLGVSQESSAFCKSECRVYEEGVYDCARQAGCFEEEGRNEEAYVACYSKCNRQAQLCSSLCSENYEVIEANCSNECKSSSECSCLHEQFIGKFGHLLPDLLSHNDTAVSEDSDDDSDDDSESDESQSEDDDDDKKKRSDSPEEELKDEDEETEDSDSNDESDGGWRS